MDAETAVLAAETLFFSSLLSADTSALDRLLTDDFQIIDVMQGAVTSKQDLLVALGAAMVRFDAIEPAEQFVRGYGDAAVVTGRTRMQMSAGQDRFEVRSRYTHVYVRQHGTWKLVSAQGTPIA